MAMRALATVQYDHNTNSLVRDRRGEVWVGGIPLSTVEEPGEGAVPHHQPIFTKFGKNSVV